MATPIREKLANGNRQQAEKDLRLALTNSPNCVEANLMFAGQLNINNRGHAAAAHVERAAAIEGRDNYKVQLCLADNYRARAKPDMAAACYSNAIAFDMTKPEARVGYMHALIDTSELASAEREAAASVARFPGHRGVIQAAAAVEAANKNFEAAAAMLQGDERPIARLDLGRYLDRTGDYAGAWGNWMAAKRQLRQGPRGGFQRAGFDRMIGGLLELATRRKQDNIPYTVQARKEKTKGPLPLFVTGFPRSGTTMVETALVAHSKIAAGDELPYIWEMTRVLPALLHVPLQYPEVMGAMGFGDNLDVASVARDLYLRKAADRPGQPWPKGTMYFTDKMPLNEIHLPLILRLFPSSPVIYVRRHPLDIILSNMSYGISHGFNYASGLRTAAYAYAAIDALLEKYRVLWPNRIAEVRYEDFVSEPRTTIDDMMLFCGNLTPESAQYNFHATGRQSRTISNRQIKEPLYDRSVGRWKNYREQLAPIFDVLRPICEREGYEL